jgi:hypothetical protein
MSARKKVNQSRPRALARVAASRVAGAVCFDAADDTKTPPTRRSSRPPSNSSANADSSMSPAPSGIYGVGFWPSAPCNRPPLIILRRATPGLVPDEGQRSCSAGESEWVKAAILRKACEFHGTRYYEGWGFREKAGFSDQVPARWRYGTFARGMLTARNAPRGFARLT